MGKRNRSSNWCPKPLRLAIYLRDGLSCVWCGSSVESGAILSLDHVHPHCFGGSNEPSNVVTSCCKCNSIRGHKTIEEFAFKVARKNSYRASRIVAHIKACVARPVNVEKAEKIIAERGYFSVVNKREE